MRAGCCGVGISRGCRWKSPRVGGGKGDTEAGEEVRAGEGRGSAWETDSLRGPGWPVALRRDSPWRPLRVTDKQVSVRHNSSSHRPPSSLSPGVRDSRSLLLAHPSTPSRARLPGEPGTRHSPSIHPRAGGRGGGGEPEEESDKCHLLRPREELLKSSPATGSKGNAPADARTPSPGPGARLGRRQRRGLGAPGLRGVPAARRGEGSREACASVPCPPAPLGPRPCHAVWGPLGCAGPRARSRCQGPEEQRPPRGTPPPQSPVRPGPEPRALTCPPGALQGPRRRDLRAAGTLSAPRPRARSACSRRPSLPGLCGPAAAAAGHSLRGPARRSALVVSGKLRGRPR